MDEAKETQYTQGRNTNTQRQNVCLPEIGPPPWEYVCRNCKSYFVVPAPHEPDDADSIRCPNCQGKNLGRLHIEDLETMDHTCFG